MIFMIALVVLGIMIMLGSSNEKARAKEGIFKWIMGVAMLFFFPYIMKYAFVLNDTIIGMIRNAYFQSGTVGEGASVSGTPDLLKEEVERRSPEYIKKTSSIISPGSNQASGMYINSIEKYSERMDVMRIMRALAGVSGRMMYVVLWFIFLGQLVIFIVIYLKRYLMIAFLIAIFPITLLEYVVSTVKGGKQSGISAWCKEFFTNVFLQTIHAILYGIITGVVVNQVRAAMENSGQPANINWLLLICAVSCVFEGEKILKEIMNASHTETVKDASEMAKNTKGMFGRVGGGIGKITNKLKP